ncbi:MAG: hypothetical protein PUC11_07430 [Elusimicrobia bacterium]|nr:hypothetical protein [Elusimicrobiota bacterium]
MSEASCKTPRFRLLFIGPGRAVFLFLFLLPEKERRRVWFTFLPTQKVKNVFDSFYAVIKKNKKVFWVAFLQKRTKKKPWGMCPGLCSEPFGG